ncbi:MAG: hypothetical protein J6P55_04200 [Bacteroidaceae bacterium]|nr:hypothetical protein [Bacteroidaceae bacterium]
MKTKLLLLLSVCIGMTSSAWALEKEGDIYQIGTAQDLRDFATAVNEGEYGAFAVLTANIDLNNEAWTSPIGSETHPYTGTFDGQGFTITKFIYTTTANNTGFFGNIGNGAVVKNFTIEGTINSTHQRVGVIGSAGNSSSVKTDIITISNIHSKVNLTCTQTRHGGVLGAQNGIGTVNIDRCTYSGTFTVTTNTAGNFAGIVGLTNNNASSTANITNCLFDGVISVATGETSTNAGGIVGYTRSCYCKIENCLSIGTITATTPGQFVGQINTNTSHMSFAGRNYYLDGEVQGTGTGEPVSGSVDPIQITDSKILANGGLCYLLNGNQSEKASWFQELGTDKYPTPNGSDVVYLNGHLHCDGTAYEGETSYSNNSESTKDEHNFVEGFCSYCDALDESYSMTPNQEGYYEIGTANQLKWFAVLVNKGGDNMAANAVLTADIDMKGAPWPNSIGNWINNIGYQGHFDGQGHKIENLEYTTNKGYHGFFGVLIDGAIVENFSIYGDVINEAYDAVAPVAYAKNQETPVYIRNIHSYLNITSSSKDRKVGGILANGNNGTTYVDRCVFSGTLKSTIKTNCGGIIAYFQNNTSSLVHITNCLFDGRIESTANDAYCGGIAGYVGTDNSVYTITNCLSVGTIDAPVAGSIFGYARNKGAGSNNNYIISGGTTYGMVKDNCSSTDNLATEVTAEQLASGEVAYNLGEAWGQFIGTDNVPSPLSELAVSYVGEAGYATMYDTTTGYELNGDVKAYAGIIKDNAYISLTEVDNIPASTAVVLKGTYYNKIEADLQPINIVNELKGAAVDTEATGSQYVLAKPENAEVGFYLANAGTIKAGKAYLELPSTEVKAFYFGGENETAIVSPLGETKEGVAIYNIAGQRINKLQKGVNIVSGHKVLF